MTQSLNIKLTYMVINSQLAFGPLDVGIDPSEVMTFAAMVKRIQGDFGLLIQNFRAIFCMLQFISVDPRHFTQSEQVSGKGCGLSLTPSVNEKDHGHFWVECSLDSLVLDMVVKIFSFYSGNIRRFRNRQKESVAYRQADGRWPNLKGSRRGQKWFRYRILDFSRSSLSELSELTINRQKSLLLLGHHIYSGNILLPLLLYIFLSGKGSVVCHMVGASSATTDQDSPGRPQLRAIKQGM